MVNNFKKLIKSFNKLPVLCKIAGILVIAIIIKLVMYCLTKNVETMSNPKELIYFYWDKCGHCKTFTPEWDSFVDSYDGPLECSKLEQEEANSAGDLKKYEIRGFPSVLLLDSNGEKIGEFNGERTVDGLNDYVNNL